MPTCCWICTHRLCALILALARGESGTLIASTPSRCSCAAPSISLLQSIPFGGTISTIVTNSPAATIVPIFDRSASIGGSTLLAAMAAAFLPPARLPHHLHTAIHRVQGPQRPPHRPRIAWGGPATSTHNARPSLHQLPRKARH